MRSFIKNKRTHIIIPVILMVILLSGCTKINISTGIDADFTAYLSYRIELDVTDVDLRYQNTLKRALNEIGWYYQEELNFSVELNIETNPYYVTMTRRLQNNSFEQAYQSLRFLLTNEDMTPFLMVDMASQTTERQNMYILNASTDIPHIMSLTNAEELSPALQEQLTKAIETGEGSITLTLPVSELVSSTHQTNVQDNQAIMVVPLSYTEQTSLGLTGTVNMLREGSFGGTLNEIIHEQYRIRSIVIIASCALLGVLFIVIIIVVLSKKAKKDSIS